MTIPDEIEITPADELAADHLSGVDYRKFPGDRDRNAEIIAEVRLGAIAAERERLLAIVNRERAECRAAADRSGFESWKGAAAVLEKLAVEMTATTPPADRPLTADDVKAFFPNHKEFGMGRGNGTQIQVTHGEVMFSFLVDTEGAVWFLPFKIGTRSRFAQLVAAFGINTKEPRA